MTIDPRIGFWMSLLTAIFSALIGAGATLTDVFGAANGKMVLAILMLVNVIISSTNTVLHAIPSKSSGLNDFYLGTGKPVP
jgi:phage-related protein